MRTPVMYSIAGAAAAGSASPASAVDKVRVNAIDRAETPGCLWFRALAEHFANRTGWQRPRRALPDTQIFKLNSSVGCLSRIRSRKRLQSKGARGPGAAWAPENHLGQKQAV